MENKGNKRIQPQLTSGVFPTAPVKPSMVPEVNDLPRCGLKAREFWVREARTETSIVVVRVQGRCKPGGGSLNAEGMARWVIPEIPDGEDAMMR